MLLLRTIVIAEFSFLMKLRAGTFGGGGWPLPPVELEHPAGQDRVRLFAKFLLEGKVAPQLNKFTSR
jgi:hypothetical protein